MGSRFNPRHQLRRVCAWTGWGILLFLGGLALPARAHPVVTRYSDAETGVRAACFDTTLDRDGVLYVASTTLLTFDGERWRSFAAGQTYAVRRLAFAADGRLWAGSIGELGWFDRQPDATWVYHSLVSQLPAEHRDFGDIFGLVVDAEGVTFVSSDKILRWSEGKFTVLPMLTQSKLVVARTGGETYVHQVEQGLMRFTPAGLEPVIPAALLGERLLIFIERREHDWLFGTSEGFFTVANGRRAEFAPELTPFLSRNRLHSACRLPDGRIAVGTGWAGLAFLQPSGKIDSYLGVEDGLPAPQVSSITPGRDGEIWITTRSNVVRIDPDPASLVFDSLSGLPDQSIRRLTLWNNRLVVANESGVHVFSPADRRFEHQEELDGWWQDVQGTSRGLLLSGSLGTFRWDGSTKTALFKSTATTQAVLESRFTPGHLFIGNDRLIERVDPAGAATPVFPLLPETVTSLAEDATGRVWMGMLSKGVWMGRPSAGHARNASDEARLRLPALSGQSYVRASRDGGIYVFARNGAWHLPSEGAAFDAVQGYPAAPIGAVSETDSSGRIWVALEKNGVLAPRVGRVEFSGGRARWTQEPVPALGVVGLPRAIVLQEAPGTEPMLWIGGTSNLVRHSLGRSRIPPPPRPPLLQVFARHGDAARRAIDRPLAFDTTAIVAELAAPEFARRPLLRLERRIEGLDTEWQPVPEGSTVTLSGLRDGRYRFHARVVDELGQESPATSFGFIVLPPWWRTFPAYAGIVALAAAAGLGYHRVRLRALRRRNAELETKVALRTEELAAASAAKTQFVATMSHDIRNPLNGIVGLALALEDTRLDDRQQQLVSTLRDCSNYLSSLVSDVLDFAAIEAGRIELHPSAYSPPDLLRSIVETMRAESEHSGSVLRIESDPALPAYVLGDAGRIQQILVNFVSNALKYAGGPIRLSAHVADLATGQIEFAVTDWGPGISPADQATLFTKFTRLKARQGDEHIPGTGLGLASCRLLAHFMDGAVGLQSDVGKGARFFLRLPLTPAAEPAKIAPATLPNATVLLVEDTDYNAWATAAVLARLGLPCERARNGAEAIRMFGEKRFNVVLLDRNLPDMDGNDVARRLRAMETDGASAVMLAVTAYCTDEDRRRCLEAGMDAFVGKPVTPEKMRRALAAVGRQGLASPTVDASDPGPLPGIDLALLTFLSGGSREKLDEQIDRFLEELTALSTLLRASSGSSDFAALGSSAHKLKGHATLVGCATLAAAAQELTEAAKGENAAGCARSLAQVTSEMQTLREAMHRHHSSRPPA